jgi:GNAT superfamily N-acetyltransferase
LTTISHRARPYSAERHADAERFLEAAQSWLLEAEIENNLLLGIALNRRGQKPAAPPLYWATIRGDAGVVGCACRTPPYPLVLSRLPAAAIDTLVDDVGKAYASLSGVNGPVAEAEAFANAWALRTGCSAQHRFRLRLHALQRVELSADLAPGALRKATEADVALARDWIDAYVRDAGLDPAAPDAAERMIGHGKLYLWIDGGKARSMAAVSRETGSGCSINGVYTPPHERRRGYATAAVAALSEALLNAGQRFCCLYTDLANPTSNSIYAKIGYRPIRNDAQMTFGADGR